MLTNGTGDTERLKTVIHRIVGTGGRVRSYFRRQRRFAHAETHFFTFHVAAGDVARELHGCDVDSAQLHAINPATNKRGHGPKNHPAIARPPTIGQKCA